MLGEGTPVSSFSHVKAVVCPVPWCPGTSVSSVGLCLSLCAPVGHSLGCVCPSSVRLCGCPRCFRSPVWYQAGVCLCVCGLRCALCASLCVSVPLSRGWHTKKGARTSLLVGSCPFLRNKMMLEWLGERGGALFGRFAVHFPVFEVPTGVSPANNLHDRAGKLGYVATDHLAEVLVPVRVAAFRATSDL